MQNTLEPEEEETVVYGPSGPMWLGNDGVLGVINDGKTNHNLHQAQETMKIAQNLRQGKESAVLIDFTNVRSMEREVREYYASEEVTSQTLAVAIISNSMVGRMIGNFFLGIQQINVPVKLFGNIKDARQWLHSQMTDVSNRK